MIKYVSEMNEIEFILSNLRDEDREELENLFGENWYQKTLDSLKDEKFLILYGQGNGKGRVPVAMGGFYEAKLCTSETRLANDAVTTGKAEGTTVMSENNFKTQSPKIACVWLLSSKYVSQNKTALMRVLRNQLYNNSDKYDILYNFIYKSNKGAKLWLRKLGFSFDNPNPENIKLKKDFEFFYKRKMQA